MGNVTEKTAAQGARAGGAKARLHVEERCRRALELKVVLHIDKGGPPAAAIAAIALCLAEQHGAALLRAELLDEVSHVLHQVGKLHPRLSVCRLHTADGRNRHQEWDTVQQERQEKVQANGGALRPRLG